MMITCRTLLCAGSFVIGAAVSYAHPAGIAISVLMPGLALWQDSRRAAYESGLCYYAGALWPLMPGARNFFGPDVSAFVAVALWATAVILLASPWPLVWTTKRGQILWRAPLGLALTVVPPLGIIGWASPITAAGCLFPGMAWWGLVLCALLPGALATYPRTATLITAVITIAANLLFRGIPPPPNGWQGVNTNFGAIAHRPVMPGAEYATAQWIQRYALSSNARVLVFPETIVPWWTEATDAFWQQTLASLRSSGKTILVGARMPQARAGVAVFDFRDELSLLRDEYQTSPPHRPSWSVRPTNRPRQDTPPFRNVLVMRGAETGTFDQRIPVPIAMWKQHDGASLHAFGPGVLSVDGHRAAILVCYEQLLTLPMLSSVMQHPNVIIAVANDHWATGTGIAEFQEAAIRMWARLFSLPFVSALNT